MKTYSTSIAFAALSLLFSHYPAVAQDAQQAGGNPIAETQPSPRIGLPFVSGKQVYITQIGDENRAAVRQHSAVGYANVRQDGDGNRADIEQKGVTLAYADVLQTGSMNDAVITQQGITAGNVVYVRQEGASNVVNSRQMNDGAIYNASSIFQNGDRNSVTLGQTGEDNEAVLTQNGNDNALTASQTGSGNRLEWTQNGNSLSGPMILQEGGSIIRVMQSGG